ncbi:CheY-like superfamily [Aspergillus unguis]
MHILVAEDNRVNQMVIGKFLGGLGCTITFVWNGQEALDYLLSSNPRPDIIFMDDSMPVMSGYEATSIIRTQPPFATDPGISTTPIIAMAASLYNLQPRTPGRYAGWRFDDAIKKPLRWASLQKIVSYWARRRVQPVHGVLPAPMNGNADIIPGRVQWPKGPRSLL